MLSLEMAQVVLKQRDLEEMQVEGIAKLWKVPAVSHTYYIGSCTCGAEQDLSLSQFTESMLDGATACAYTTHRHSFVGHAKGAVTR